MLSFLTRGPCTDARHIPAGKRPRTLPSVAEFGWALAPCKDWPSATAYGGCGLDRGPAPNSRLPPGQRRRRPLARANPRGRFFERKWVHFRECRGLPSILGMEAPLLGRAERSIPAARRGA